MIGVFLPFASIILPDLLLVGLALLTLGLRGRRVGDEPRCRKCDYDLSLLTSERCPECGTSITDQRIRIGHQQRFAKTWSTGLALVIISGTGIGMRMYSASQGINWYPHMPTFVVLDAAKDDNRLAIMEVIKRFQDRAITGEQVLRLLTTALDRQDESNGSSARWAWTDLLAEMDVDGLLTNAQRERFYDQIGSFRLEFRPKIRQGDEVMINFWNWTLGSPLLNGSYRIEDGELQIIDRTMPLHSLGGDDLSVRGAGGSVGFPFQTDEFAPGVYQVRYRATKLFLCGNDTDWNQPSFTKDIDLKYELEILPADAPDPLQLINDPTLADDFKDAISIRLTDKPLGGTWNSGTMSVEINVSGFVPMDAAFEIIGFVGDQELNLGTLTVKKGKQQNTSSRSYGEDLHLSAGDLLVPVLRSSAEVALETHDIFEIWDGEIRLDPITVERTSEEPD